MKELMLDKPGGAEDAREFAYRTLKKNLLNFVLVPGDRMSEAAAADALGASRTPVHDAFARLAEEGLLCVVPQKGTVVAGIDADRVRQTVFMRARLGEAVCGEVITQGVSAELLFRAQTCVNRQYYLLGAHNYAELAEADDALHRLFFEACGYGLVWDALESVSADVRRVCVLAGRGGRFWEQRSELVSGLLDALQRRSAERLCELARAHLTQPLNVLPGLVKKHAELFSTLDDSRRLLAEHP